MKITNFFKLLCLFMVTGIILFSCKKTNTTHSSPMVGYWYGTVTGTIGVGNYQGNESMLFRNDGSLLNYDFYGAASLTDTTVAYRATGAYTLNGNKIVCKFTYPSGAVFNATGTLNTAVNPATMVLTFTGTNNGNLSTGTLNLTHQ